MIINVIFELVQTLITTIFGVLPSLPPMPVGITDALTTFNEFIVYGFRMITRIVGGNFILIVLPIFALLINFKYIYHMTMWIVRKLPIGAN